MDQNTTATHTQSPVTAIAASTPGALPGFESTCTCGLVMRNSIRVNVVLDVMQHMAFHAAAAKPVRTRLPGRYASGREACRELAR